MNKPIEAYSSTHTSMGLQHWSIVVENILNFGKIFVHQVNSSNLHPFETSTAIMKLTENLGFFPLLTKLISFGVAGILCLNCMENIES